MDRFIRNIVIKDSLLDPNGQSLKSKAYFKSPKEGRELYKVHIYLEGRDLPFVKEVKYILHKSFRNPVVKVPRTLDNQNCMLTIWTWGIFTVKAEIEDVNGQILRLEHYLNYGDQINQPEIEFIEKK